MITTITTSTITIVATLAIAGSLGLTAILVLLSLLIQKEIASSVQGSRCKRFSRTLNIGIIPLLIVFVWIVAARVMDVLR
ncbi:MAG: hypothetical protein ACM3PY_03500 [Omnitrophica WOR_2 bacterium]